MRVELIQASRLIVAVKAARICYGKTVDGNNASPEDIKLLKKIIVDFDPAHDSIIEHLHYTWQIEDISRACSHQLVRHRIASYSQKSQRYVSEVGFKEVCPKSVHEYGAHDLWSSAIDEIEKCYQSMINKGVPKQDARFLLPNACTTSLIMTMNARSFRNFLKLRLHKKAQWEIRKLASKMFELIPEDHKFMFQKEVQ